MSIPTNQLRLFDLETQLDSDSLALRRPLGVWGVQGGKGRRLQRPKNARRIAKLKGRRVYLTADRRILLPDTRSGRDLIVSLGVACSPDGDYLSIAYSSEAYRLLVGAKTESPPPPPAPIVEKSPVVAALMACGIAEPVAVGLAQDAWLTLERVEEWQAYIADPPFTLNNPPGFVVCKLRAHQAAPKVSKTPKAFDWSQVDTSDPESDYYLPDPDSYPTRPVEAVSPEAAAMPEEAKRIWATTYRELGLSLPRETFDTWLRTAQLGGYDSATDAYTVTVDNLYARESLDGRLRQVILRTLRRVSRCEATEAVFVLRDPR